MAWDATHEPASLDGHIEPYQPAWLIDSFIADPLLILGPDGEFHPALAASWTSSENADEWTFNLRDDVKFQDGTPFDAEALKYNIERILHPDTRSAEMAARLGPVESIEIVDAKTVKFHYDEPWVTLLDALWRMPVWSPTAAEKWGVEEFDKHLVGAGPFTLEEWVPNSHVTLERWEDYGGWNSISEHGGPAHLTKVTIHFIGEEAVLGNMVKTGDAHIAMNLPATYIGDYVDVDGFELVTGFQAGTGLQMVMNTRKPPFDILEFRRALLYGTDQIAINDLLFDGTYLPSYGPLNTVHPCYWEGSEDRYPHDPDQAKALLEQAGYVDRDGDGIREAYGVRGVDDGTPLSFKWTVLNYEEIGEAVQSQWRELGINLIVEMVPGPVQLERVNTREFDLIYERQRSPDPNLLEMVWNSAWDVVGGWAWTGFVDAELDETVRQLRVVPDPEARCELAKKAQRIIMDNALMLPTLSEPVFYAVSEKVQGFQLMSEGNYFFLHNTTVAN
jgi:peptide/nickel transport system substrate-binding protein